MVEAYRIDPIIAEQLGRAHPLARHLDDFLTDLANAGTSPHTRRAYRSDLIAFAAHHGEEIGELTATPIRAYLAELAELSPASRKRKRAGSGSARQRLRGPVPRAQARSSLQSRLETRWSATANCAPRSPTSPPGSKRPMANCASSGSSPPRPRAY
ncbi:hypothetical protein Misp01_20800 [Microtetraspora sp. NBRC 13810]|uniref:site-specific integrase n=1 Tax=Microtetraspora sp. NBRC 13810 TaxID=3030990 RepID=UPI0024A391CC|nr:site-specific integrase [Microtetraspora sp. NBRC 13810]GLW06950.1 hypothetical protein Misp01_20800 [Microtetraspora sp. NBRC 13810]